MATNGTGGISASGGNVSIDQADTAYEQHLRTALASILLDCGFESCNAKALQVLQTVLEHFLHRVGQTTRAYAEAAGRTQPVLGDATVALVDYGVTVSALIDFARQRGGSGGGGDSRPAANIPAAFGHDWLAEAALKRPHQPQNQQQQQHGPSRPSHVPDHLPPYPRPHTFVWTPARRPRGDDFEERRRRAAETRRQAELSLTRFLAATGQAAAATHSLFPGEVSAGAGSSHPYLLTAGDPCPRPYVPALMAAAAEDSAAVVPRQLMAQQQHQLHPNPYMRPAKFPL